VGRFVLDFEPGSRWGYSALDGMDTLLHVVELVSGQEAEAFLHERLFAPLDMHDTYFNVPAAKQARVLTLYERRDNAWRRATPMFGNAPTRYISGAGGLMSTAHDFLNFEVMLLNRGTFNGRRVLRPETVALMTTNHVGTLFAEWIPPITSGLGFGLGGSVVLDPQLLQNGRGLGSYGWGGAYGTDSWIDPQHNIASVYFVQQSGDFAGRAYGRAIREALV
jgi:CubicO group peptidase (beta-lactamase class C family)